jgi:hypothetical protein
MKTKKHNKVLSFFIVLLIIVALLIALTALYFNEIRSLTSLTKKDEHPLYQMTYYGDYGFDEFLKTGAHSDSDIEAFVTKRLLKGVPIDLGVTGDGCTAFVTKNEKGEVIFGRNFDFDYAPSLQVKTTPKDGYASISTVNLTFAGYSKDNLPDSLPDSFLTLAAPYLPFDGVNEKGVAMALLAVPEYHYTDDDSKVTLNTTTAIRLVLDKAANVNEAVELLRDYNIYFSGDVDCHFLIADATGKSVIVEYWDGQLQTVYPENDYQIASNFVAYNGLNIGEEYSEFDRYDTVEKTIQDNNNALSREKVISLLTEIGCKNDDGTNRLQWSVCYNLNSLDGYIFADRNSDNIFDFELEKD